MRDGRIKKYIGVWVIIALLITVLWGCGGKEGPTVDSQTQENSTVSSGDGEEEGNTQQSETEDATVDFSLTDNDMFTDRDLRTSYDVSEAVEIRLQGNTATASSDSVKISGSTVQLTEEAVYIISGTLEDGMLVVNASDQDKLQLVLNGVDITSASSAALYILEADKVVITLAEGTENKLTNGGTFTPIDDNNIDAALFSKQDLTINGSGSLTVTSPAGHGIVGKDDLVITGGVLQVEAASHAMDANDSVRITNAAITAVAGKDGIHCENTEDPFRGFVYISGGTLDVDAQGDGISSNNYIHITDGDFRIVAGGGSENGTKESSDFWGGFMGGGFGGGGGRPGGRQEGGYDGQSEGTYGDRPEMNGSTPADGSTSMKGIKAEKEIRISGGKFTIDSADDAIHSDASLTIAGGTYEIASGDDAIHAEDTLLVENGTIHISECYEGLEALHVTVAGGDIRLTASDDGLNAAGGTDGSGTTGGRDGMFGGRGPGGMMSSNSNGSIVISGGTLYINSSGDGIDANGTLEISGGHTTIVGPTQGDTATLDYDKTAVISGGTFIGTGSSMMAQTFSDNTQGVIALSVGSQSAKTPITVADQAGKTILTYEPELSYEVVIISMPEIVSGETYRVTVGELNGEFEAG